MTQTAVGTKYLYCGRCYHDRGKRVPISILVGVDRRRAMFCSFCGEERHDGGMRLRVHIAPDMGGTGTQKENVLEIPHIVALE